MPGVVRGCGGQWIRGVRVCDLCAGVLGNKSGAGVGYSWDVLIAVRDGLNGNSIFVLNRYLFLKIE